MSFLLFLLVWAGIAAVPYAMYLVAWLFESRKPGNGPRDVPVWRDQSRAFLPGGFGLSLAVTVVILAEVSRPAWASNWWWILASLLAGVLVFYIGRRVMYSPSDYTPQAWKSPSKRWHDFVMFFGFTAAVCYLFVPSLFGGFFSQENYPLVLLMISGLGFWVYGVIYDVIQKQVPNKRQHPTNYKPIWK